MAGTAAEQHPHGSAITTPHRPPGPASAAKPPIFAGKRVVITGRLASTTRQEAHRIVRQYGGQPSGALSRRTHLLVVGEEGWPLRPDGRLPRKLMLALRFQRLGYAIEIITETEWLGRIGLVDYQQQIHRHYTPAMLSRILDVPVTEIRQWARRGLIRPVRQVFRLPYFDFQEVAGARVLAQLVTGGVSAERIERALVQLRNWLPGVDRPLAQLAILAEGGQMLVRRSRTLLEPSGQKLLPFEEPDETDRGTDTDQPEQKRASRGPSSPEVALVHRPDARDAGESSWSGDAAARLEGRSSHEWFALGCEWEEDEQLDQAAEAYRTALLLGGPEAEVSFHLANVLYRMGQVPAAMERYRCALEIEPDYVEAWNNLGSLLSETGQLEAAADAFRTCLAVHPDYPDAHFNLADTLAELGRHDEAVPHWEAYLHHDSRSPWADEARRQLHPHLNS